MEGPLGRKSPTSGKSRRSRQEEASAITHSYEGNSSANGQIDIMKKSFAFGAVTIAVVLSSGASQPLEDALQPSAVKVAQQRGASELGCPAATAEVISKHAIEEPQTTGWYEFPRQAEYEIAVSGCGKRTTYLVACNKFHSACKAGPVPTSTGSAAPRHGG